jgi:hypothetical protein
MVSDGPRGSFPPSRPCLDLYPERLWDARRPAPRIVWRPTPPAPRR